MNILNISTEIRHGLACAASLAMRGHRIIHIQLGERNFTAKRVKAQVDTGIAEIEYIGLPTPQRYVLRKVARLISENIINGELIDVIITMPSVSFYLARALSSKLRVPLILRISSLGIYDMFKEAIALFHWYRGILELAPALRRLTENLEHSNIVIAHSAHIAKFLKRKLPLRKPILIYPTYAKVVEKTQNQFKVNIEKWSLEKHYNILGVTTVGRSGLGSRHDIMILEILYIIAKRNPEINVIVLGSNDVEARRSLNLYSLPPNMRFLGFIYDDTLMERIYECSSLIISPVFFRAVSNRILEALFYGKPILTNSYVREIFPELKHGISVYISDRYEKYPHIVHSLLNSSNILEGLTEGAKKAWKELFSERVFGSKMETVLKNLEGSHSFSIYTPLGE
jgi:glycosyltransferase involved in cell wall biosynthesis